MTKALILFSATAMVFAAQLASAADPVRIISGGPAALKKVEPHKDAMTKAAGVPVDVKVTPFALALKALVNGVVDGVFTPPLPAALAAAEKEGMPKQNPDDFQWFIAQDVTLWYALHPDNPVNELNRQQLTDIISGKIKNWKEVGGKDAPISMVIPTAYSASMRAISMFYIKADKFPHAEEVSTREGVLKSMAKNPNQLGFFTTNEADATLKPKFFKTEAQHRLIFVMKKKTRPEAQKVFDYVKANAATIFKD
jgi:phosphate transport system substrate-binding protein